LSDRDIAALFEGREGKIAGRLERYMAAIERFNPAYGLVSVRDRRELTVKHILDSLAPLGILIRLLAERRTGETAARIADAGSGAGLPGIPLAAALPDFSFTLIERMGRRAGFLRSVIPALGLVNAAVEEGEIEKAVPERFDLVAFRALHPLEPEFFKGLSRLLKEGGILAAYKGRREKAAEEAAALAPLKIHSVIYPCPVPFLDEERHLLAVGGIHTRKPASPGSSFRT
jgi:16S rRNA (guanine527-N7)-methyltransferase